jgi:peptidoglycan/LPS O-acetylase OafA/YrhL
MLRAERSVPSLDGIRAISVGIVILSHLMIALGATHTFLDRLVMQGDLGVHVFFVISGFLISSILLRELNRTGRIDLKRCSACAPPWSPAGSAHTSVVRIHLSLPETSSC